MDISSVYRQPLAPTSSASSTARSDATQQAQNRALRQDNADLKKADAVPEAKPPQPVVNSQGQTTGRIVNTTA